MITVKKLNTWILITLLANFTANALARNVNNVEVELLQDIKKSTVKYQKTSQEIDRARRQLLVKLEKREQSLKQLRHKSAILQRARDEQNISLEKINQRLEQWQQQVYYLNNLVVELAPVHVEQNDAVSGWQQLENYVVKLENRLQPQWKKEKVAIENGQLIDGQKLSIGPAQWFISADDRHAGMIISSNEKDSIPSIALQFNDNQRSQLQLLQKESSAEIAIDPTLNRSIKLAQSKDTVLTHLKKGGIWVYPIVFFAFIATFIAIVKAYTLMSMAKVDEQFATRLKMLVEQKNCYKATLANIGTDQRKLAEVALATENQQTRDDALFTQLLLIKIKVEKGLTAITVTASVAPLLGLLGTVSGMIHTFKLMTLFGAGDANAVSSGISESLVTTELGLMVAIPALVAHALMSRRVHHYMSQLEVQAIELAQINLQLEDETLVAA